MVPYKRAIALSSALQDVQQPRVCPTCLSVVAVQLQPNTEQNPRLLEELRDNHPEFWNSSIAFLTSPRTEDDLPALRRQLLENVRNCKYRTEHNTVIRSNFTDPVHTLVESLYMALLACLARGRHPMINRPKAPKGFGTRHGRWPETADKLFPFGEQQSVEMHVFWASLRFSASPLAVLSCMFIVARTMILPHLLTPGPTRTRFVYILAQALRADVTTIPEGWEGASPVQPAGDRQLPLALPKERVALVETSTSFLEILVDGLDGKMLEFFPFCDGYERVLFNAILVASRALNPSKPAFTALTGLIHYLRIKLDLPASALDGAPSAIRQFPGMPDATGKESGLEDFPRMTRMHLIRLSKQRGCSSPGCGKTVHENGGRPFATCSKCKTVRYCGRDCQQRDWKTGTHPHKVICPILCRLLAQTSINTSLEEFESVFENVLDIEERLTLFQWSTSAGLLFSEKSTRNISSGFQLMNELKEGILKQPNEVQDQFLERFQNMPSANPDDIMRLLQQTFADFKT